MRKVLLATTALVGFAVAGAAQAATAPLAVTVGGDVNFLAGAAHESKSVIENQTGGDFETLYSLNFDVAGKASNGIEYGGNLVLDNYPTLNNGFGFLSDNILEVTTADVYMSGAFGKVVLGDSHGATDLAIAAPRVNDVRYIDFLSTNGYAKDLIVGIDGTDYSTNVTYFTPKVGNETHKVQAGVSYVPNFGDVGNSVVLDQTALGAYKNMFKGAIAYTGSFKPATIGISADAITAGGVNSTRLRQFTAWGVGAQAAAQGFTVGVDYTDLGHFGTVKDAGNNKDGDMLGAGVKYEFSKVAVGANYTGGEGYSAVTGDYVSHFNNYSLSGAYTWAPGLTTAADAVLFDQKGDTDGHNDGYVLLLSQKLAF